MTSPRTISTSTTDTPSRRQVLKWAAAAGLTTLAAPTLAACAGGGSNGRRSSTVKLIHASKDPLVLWSVTYLAEDKGFYKDEGLNIERVLLAGGPAAMTGLLSGAGQANLSAPGELLSAVTKGQKLKVLMAHTNSMPSILVVSSKFAAQAGVTADSSLEDRQAAVGRVKGGRFGITAPGSQTDGFTRLALKQAGLDPAKDAKIVPLQTAANSLAALANDQIDGFIGVPPAAEKAVHELQAVPLLVNQAGEIRGGDRFQGMTMQARREDVESNPDLYAALVRADVRALRTLVEDPDAAGALLRKARFGKLEEPIWTMTWGLVQKSWGSPVVTQDSLDAWFQAGLVNGGDADGSGFPFGDVIDMQFVNNAVKEIAWTPQQK
jgi:NitT/TauT family transport system substrate-binding protein